MKLPRVSLLVVVVLAIGGLVTLVTFTQLPLGAVGDLADDPSPGGGRVVAFAADPSGCAASTPADELLAVRRNATAGPGVTTVLDVEGRLSTTGERVIPTGSVREVGPGTYVLSVRGMGGSGDCPVSADYTATVRLAEPADGRVTLVVSHDGRLVGVVTATDDRLVVNATAPS